MRKRASSHDASKLFSVRQLLCFACKSCAKRATVKTYECSTTRPCRIIRFALFTFPLFLAFLSLLLYFFFFSFTEHSLALRRSLWDTFLPISILPPLPLAPLLRSLLVATVQVGGTFALLHRIPVKLITSGKRALGYLIRATNTWPAFQICSVITDSICAR